MAETTTTYPVRETYHHGDLRRTLITVATDAITELGPTKTSLREAARRAGVSGPAALHHFKDKSALLAAVAICGFEELISRRERLVEGQTSPEKRLRIYVEAYVGFAIEKPAIFNLMFGPLIAPRENYPDLKKAGLRSFRALKTEVQAYLEHVGVEKDGNTATWVVWSAAHGLSSLLVDFPSAQERPENLSDQALLDAMMENLLAGLRRG